MSTFFIFFYDLSRPIEGIFFFSRNNCRKCFLFEKKMIKGSVNLGRGEGGRSPPPKKGLGSAFGYHLLLS